MTYGEVSGWIPVEREIPGHVGMVIVAIPGYGEAHAGYCGMDRKWRWGASGQLMQDAPTHWRPMPPLPGEGGADKGQGPQPSRWLPEPGPTTAAEAKEAWGLSEARARRDVERAKNRLMRLRLDELEVRVQLLEAQR